MVMLVVLAVSGSEQSRRFCTPVIVRDRREVGVRYCWRGVIRSPRLPLIVQRDKGPLPGMAIAPPIRAHERGRLGLLTESRDQPNILLLDLTINFIL